MPFNFAPQIFELCDISPLLPVLLLFYALIGCIVSVLANQAARCKDAKRREFPMSGSETGLKAYKVAIYARLTQVLLKIISENDI